jgi:hypothetical protein
MENNVFAELNSVNVNGHVEKKNGLTYLSWAFAWAEVKKRYPDAIYTIYENKDGLFYHTDGRTAWVKTGVTINGIEHIEYLPVMDMRNKSIPVENVTSFDVNKAIQRSLTKACARHGLGLYIYAGEDLPESEQEPLVPNKDEIAEMSTVRTQILGLAKGDIDALNGLIEKWSNGKYKSLDGMSLADMKNLKLAIVKAKQGAEK